MIHARPRFGLFLVTYMAVIFASLIRPASAQIADHPVISEVYGGGGNSGALYTHDFIELYNPLSTVVEMTGWSVQYQTGGGSGSFSSVAVFSGTIPAHGFFLIQCNPGSGGSVPLPPPDIVAGISMAAGSGKVALVRDSLAISGETDSTVVDFVGYGSANLYEGSGAASSPGNTSSIERKAGAASLQEDMEPGGADESSGNGWDSDDNEADFLLRSEPGPQNSSSDAENPGGAIDITVDYQDKWNLVSVPLMVDDPQATIVFPGAVSALYGYDGGYFTETTVDPGRGYWAKFSSPDSVTFSGSELLIDTITLQPGWNLVGSIYIAVSVDSVIQVPGGHLETGFYAYDGGYVPAALILPGRGYWVKSGSGGLIVLH